MGGGGRRQEETGEEKGGWQEAERDVSMEAGHGSDKV